MGTRFSARPDRPWGPPSLPYNQYQVFPEGKVRPGRAADHSPHSSAAVMDPLGHTGPVTGKLYLISLGWLTSLLTRLLLQPMKDWVFVVVYFMFFPRCFHFNSFVLILCCLLACVVVSHSGIAEVTVLLRCDTDMDFSK